MAFKFYIGHEKDCNKKNDDKMIYNIYVSRVNLSVLTASTWVF